MKKDRLVGDSNVPMTIDLDVHNEALSIYVCMLYRLPCRISTKWLSGLPYMVSSTKVDSVSLSLYDHRCFVRSALFYFGRVFRDTAGDSVPQARRLRA